ncbi:metal-dependent transcriptional regulator [uncultured Cytophaga sp.]|uniref:metal-dependent transcriptional regulator n=1 Tax=uncultured Cytophaga sp. TaxID=160238 RepID=UPI0026111370|nr:metal-dependent transcriptional regulator [uncultured Cytophaga sp.]
MLTHTEENYIKTIYHLSGDTNKDVSTNGISDVLKTKPASVTDMLKKLSDKSYLNYIKYQGVTLTKKGKQEALQIIRKHRLWEVFLVEKLKFHWDEVHEIAEQLEHIQSNVLIDRLDEFLGNPSVDPHGDPIPDQKGEFISRKKYLLSDLPVGFKGKVVGMIETSPAFLQYLDRLSISPGAKIQIKERIEFDGSLEIVLQGKNTFVISHEVAKNLYVTD